MLSNLPLPLFSIGLRRRSLSSSDGAASAQKHGAAELLFLVGEDRFRPHLTADLRHACTSLSLPQRRGDLLTCEELHRSLLRLAMSSTGGSPSHWSNLMDKISLISRDPLSFLGAFMPRVAL